MHYISPAMSLQRSHSATAKGATFFHKVWVDRYTISMFAVIAGFPQFHKSCLLASVSVSSDSSHESGMRFTLVQFVQSLSETHLGLCAEWLGMSCGYSQEYQNLFSFHISPLPLFPPFSFLSYPPSYPSSFPPTISPSLLPLLFLSSFPQEEQVQ